MRRQTAEAVEAAVSSRKAEIVRLAGDCRHFLSSLAEVMHEVIALRNKYEDWEDWGEAKEEEYGEVEGDRSNWYRDETGYLNAAGAVLDYSERMKRAAAHLFGPMSGQAEATEAHDFVAAAKKAALAAALATTEASRQTKAYGKLSVPSFPKIGEMTNWIYSLGTAVVAAAFLVMGLK